MSKIIFYSVALYCVYALFFLIKGAIDERREQSLLFKDESGS